MATHLGKREKLGENILDEKVREIYAKVSESGEN